MPQQTPERSGKHSVLRNQFRVGAYLKGFPSLKGEEPRHPGSGLFSSGGFPPTSRTGLVHKWRLIIPAQVSSHPALEETHRNVWLVLKAHGWEPEQELDMDIAQTLVVLAKMGVTDTRELLRLTLEHFELAPLN